MGDLKKFAKIWTKESVGVETDWAEGHSYKVGLGRHRRLGSVERCKLASGETAPWQKESTAVSDIYSMCLATG